MVDKHRFVISPLHEPQLCLETFALVQGLIAAEAAPPLTVKGFTTPVRAYRMTIAG